LILLAILLYFLIKYYLLISKDWEWRKAS
jgi:hypothetical protein